MKWKDPKYLDKEYNKNRRSASDIAGEHGVFPNQVRRELIKCGFVLRNKSAAQKLNIEKNGTPTQGRTRTPEEKERISGGLQRFWDDLTPDQYKAAKERLSAVAAKKWADLNDEEKSKAIKLMHAASRNKGREGSINENAIADMLKESGFPVEQRTNEYTPKRQFEIDICIPQMKIAIEWDGVTHFSPVYGEEHLARVQEKDGRKDKILIGGGWTVIRCQDHSTTPSVAFCRRTVEKIVPLIMSGEKNVVHIVEAR